MYIALYLVAYGVYKVIPSIVTITSVQLEFGFDKNVYAKRSDN